MEEPDKINWGPKQNEAFTKLKEFSFSIAVLRLACINQEFVLRTDASDIAVSAALFQEHDGVLFPVNFGSQKSSETQKKYAISEKEA